MKLTHRHTLFAAYLGYVSQAIINNLPPLLFVAFQTELKVSLTEISLLITVNFSVQIVVDLIAVRMADRIGYRAAAFSAQLCSTLGLISFCVLPGWMDPYGGLLISMAVCAMGSGMNEVLISPIVESLPGDQKAGAMSLLHSFYCWGHMAVVLLSTLYFTLFGVASWRLLFLLWASVPLFDALFFLRVPLYPLVKDGQTMQLRRLLSTPALWLMLLLMVCSGAAEQAMSQWSSYFAETGLHVSKTLGDLMGPCTFAFLMGVSRVFYGKRNGSLPFRKALAGSAALSVFSYLLAVFSPIPILSLVGCSLCGLSVGIMWPGTTSLSAQTFPRGGTAMFALLAFSGDIGCSAGPAVVAAVSNLTQKGMSSWLLRLTQGTPLKAGLLVAVLFPLCMILLLGLKHQKKPL